MSIVTREGKGSRLTTQEMDGNFNYLYTASLGGGYEEVIVNISSADILSMGTTPIELLPAIGVNKYYDIDIIVFEMNLSNYSLGGDTADFLKLDYNGADITHVISSKLIQSYEPCILVIKNFYQKSTVNIVSGPFGDLAGAVVEPNSVIYPQVAVNNITLSTVDETNPTDGTDTMRAIIKYKVRTFGE
jgi:hypothetical protein